MSKRKFNNDLGKHPKDKLIKKIKIDHICIPYDDIYHPERFTFDKKVNWA